MNPLRSLPRPLILAHRGDSAHAPENTLAAFRLAVEKGAHGVELDAKLSADGVAVVMHDATVERTTNGKGAVSALPLAEIKALDAGSHFSEAFAGEPVPTLEEVFAALGDHTLIDVELTNYASPFDDLPERVAELVRRFHLEESVILTTFHPVTLLRACRLLPDLPMGLLALPGSAGGPSRAWPGTWLQHEILIPNEADVSPALVERAHVQKRALYAYTVDEPERMRCLVEMGVDGLISDDPALALQVVERAPV